jgi:hypothetical protein
MLAYAGVWTPKHVDEAGVCWRMLAYGSLSMSTKTNSANSLLTLTPNFRMRLRLGGEGVQGEITKMTLVCVCAYCGIPTRNL